MSLIDMPIEEMKPNDFPSGVAIFFRVLASPDSLARSIHPTGRSVELSNDDYTIRDDEGSLLGIYPRDFVAAILPILTIGPSGV